MSKCIYSVTKAKVKKQSTTQKKFIAASALGGFLFTIKFGWSTKFERNWKHKKQRVSLSISAAVWLVYRSVTRRRIDRSPVLIAHLCHRRILLRTKRFRYNRNRCRPLSELKWKPSLNKHRVPTSTIIMSMYLIYRIQLKIRCQLLSVQILTQLLPMARNLFKIATGFFLKAHRRVLTCRLYMSYVTRVVCHCRAFNKPLEGCHFIFSEPSVSLINLLIINF